MESAQGWDFGLVYQCGNCFCFERAFFTSFFPQKNKANWNCAKKKQVAAVFLISVGSGLILTLAGVLKDILLISGSVLAFGSPITGLQVFGYSISLSGLILFKTTGGK